MNWNEDIQKIIDYIEDKLQASEDIDPFVIARFAGCSYTFFQKVFSYINGISLAEYIRCRKLTLAGYDLKSTKMKVVEISYKYGYDSPTSFTKAFRIFHGISPSTSRKQEAKLHVFPKMKLQAASNYAWHLEKKRAFCLAGYSCMLPQNRKTAIPAFWHQCQRDGRFAKLIQLDEAERKGLFGVFWHGEQDDNKYSIMCKTTQSCSDEFEIIEIPAATWAIFTCKGPVPYAIQAGWNFLNHEWINTYPFVHDDGPELEWYSNQNAFDEDYLSEIWIPIKEE